MTWQIFCHVTELPLSKEDFNRMLSVQSTNIHRRHADDSEQKSGPLPASKAAIDAMPRSTVTEQDGAKDCFVCVGSEATKMPCKHGFHLACIEKWLWIHGSCPVCRFLMPVEDADDGGSEGGRRQRRRISAFVVLRGGPDSESVEDSDLGSADASHDAASY